jgi:hypothetical protein
MIEDCSAADNLDKDRALIMHEILLGWVGAECRCMDVIYGWRRRLTWASSQRNTVNSPACHFLHSSLPPAERWAMLHQRAPPPAGASLLNLHHRNHHRRIHMPPLRAAQTMALRAPSNPQHTAPNRDGRRAFTHCRPRHRSSPARA